MAAQEPLPLVSVEVDLGAYGMERAEDVRRGRLSIAYHTDGPRLAVYYLRDDPVRPRVTYPEPPPTPEPHEGPVTEPRQKPRSSWTATSSSWPASRSPAFAGLAFHDYRGLKRLLSGGL